MDTKAGKLIDQLGGTNTVANLCMVRAPSVSEWRHRGIPHARLMYLQAMAQTHADIADALRCAGYRPDPLPEREAA